MLRDLAQLAEKVIARPVALGDLKHRGATCATPWQALEVAQGFASLVVRNAKNVFDGSTSIDFDLILDLFAFLSTPPEELRREIRALADFPPAPLNAWQRGDAFSSLMDLVHDVWEHTFGPEVEDDPRMISLLLEEDFKHVCDYGSGAGYYSFYLARHGVHVACVEIDPVKRSFLEFRKERHVEGRRISFDMHDQLFDAVLAINVFDHLEDASGLVAEIATRLKPGGKLCYFAQFIDDGWHQSSARVKEATFSQLARHFTFPHNPKDSDSYFEMLERGDGGYELLARAVPVDERALLKPVVHYAVHASPLDETGETFALQAPRFYITPLSVTRELKHLLDFCRSGLTVAELSQRMRELEVDDDEVWSCLELLWQHHLIGMDTSLVQGRESFTTETAAKSWSHDVPTTAITV